MDAAELDILLEELESRVERLRSLYEQYFLGIEKIPPNVAHKDVDRRIYILRREQIRNTAKRFKLQTVIQRYNTFQQYWLRIMREIEHGTYRRHVLRAERTVGVTDALTANERKRLGLPERPTPSSKPPAVAAFETSEPSETAASVLPKPSTQSATPSDVKAQMERDLGHMLDHDLDGDVDHELDELEMKSMFGAGKELDDPLLSSMPPPARARKPSARPVPRRSARPIAAPHGQQGPQTPQPPIGSTSAAAFPRSLQSVSSNPSAASASGQPARKSLRPVRFAPGSGSPAAPGGLRLPASSAVAGRGLPPLPKPGVPRGAPPKVPSSPIIALENKQQPRAPKSVVPPAGATPDQTAPSSRNSVPRGLPHPSESIAPRPSAAPTRTAAKSLRPEAASKPITPQTSPKPAVPPSSAHTNSPQHKASDPLDRYRIEQLAEKLRDARKQTHEAAAVSVDALAKKLHASAEELHKKHAGKRVDFDVVIKDGKAIIKPIVK